MAPTPPRQLVLAAVEEEKYYLGSTTLYVILSCILLASGGLLFGYNIGISGGVEAMKNLQSKFFRGTARNIKVQHFTKEPEYNNHWLQTATAVLSLAALVSTFVVYWVTDKYGRKLTMLLAGFVSVVAAGHIAGAKSLAMLVVGRALMDWGIGFANQVSRLRPEASQMEPEQQVPMTVWCGGINEGQDVSVRLVPNGINQQQVTNLRSQEPLAVLKVHSTRLKKYSKYFQACLSTRWTHPDAPPSMEFNLELIHELQVASYTDCFSRMYKPLRKNFKDVKSSLELLRVASQIEFLKLVNSICQYLSQIPWSVEDELRIRQFSSSPDFPRSQAEDLVARLQIGKYGNSRKMLLRHQIVRSIRIVLCSKNRMVDRESSCSAQSLFEDLFCSIRQSNIDSAFDNDLVTIVIKEVKKLLESLHKDRHAILHDYWEETRVGFHVDDFKRKFKALCWALELLLKIQAAEEVIECLLHLENFFPIILLAQEMDSSQPTSERVSLRFAKLMIFIFREVAAGRLLLGIPDRVLLIERWQWLACIHDLDPQNDILVTWGFGQALEGVFLTLPLEQQMEALQRNNFFSHAFINKSSLVNLMKRNRRTEEDALV